MNLSTTLKPKQLKFIASWTANIKVRPTLANIYYNPILKVLASTDASRLHTIEINLGDEPLWFTPKGELLPDCKATFPGFDQFFPSNPTHHQFTHTLIDQYKAFDMMIIKNKSLEYGINHRNISGSIIQESPKLDIPFDIKCNPVFLNDIIKDMKSTMIHLGSTNLNPIEITWTIDGRSTRSILMPLKF